MSAFLRWRLFTETGVTARCYVDSLPGGLWLLAVWRGADLLVYEVHDKHETAGEQSEQFRADLLARGWREAPH